MSSPNRSIAPEAKAQGVRTGGVVAGSGERCALTPRQLEILQHSLGVDRYGQGERYRNRFVAGDDDLVTCHELVALGYMAELTPTIELCGVLFRVSPAGEMAMERLSPAPPKLTRSQERYRRYLRIADAYDGLTFREYLRTEREWTR